jgi:hypothetical protein
MPFDKSQVQNVLNVLNVRNALNKKNKKHEEIPQFLGREPLLTPLVV